MILFVTDNETRSNKLVRNLDLKKCTHIHDLDCATAPSDAPELIVVDIDNFDSSVIVRLRSVLNQIRGSDVRLLLLSHSNPARAQVQAGLIDATETVPANSALATLRAKIAQMWERVAAPPVVAADMLVAEARQFLVQAFFSGRTVTPEIAAAGSDLIARAIAENGIRGWVSAVQRFDNATHQHCLLVAGLGAAFAVKLGLGRTESFRLTKAALLHDVGKTRIPLSILNKPGPLNAEEKAVMHTHPVEGYEMLRGGGFSEETLMVVRSHHELLDGSGYPDGLRDKQIPDLVRLVTICDIYGALIERRPYKPPMQALKAFSILESMKGRLDADLVKIFRPIAASMI